MLSYRYVNTYVCMYKKWHDTKVQLTSAAEYKQNYIKQTHTFNKPGPVEKEMCFT